MTADGKQRRSWVDAAEGFTRAVNRLFALTASILVVAIVVVIVREVVLRYGFNAPSTWGMDVARYLLQFAFFLALAPALESGHHVHVDLFDPMVPPAWRRVQRLCGHVLVVFFGAVLFWYVLQLTIDVFESDEFSFSVIPIRLKYIYWIGPVGTLQFLLTGCVQLVRAWSDPTAPGNGGRTPPRRRDGSGAMESFLGFLVFILVLMALMVTRTPVAVALGTIGILGTPIFVSPQALRQLGNIAFTQSSNFVLVVVPLFVLMGEALAATGIGNDLFRAAHMWLRRLPGALAVATVFACAVFAAVCGSSPVTAATIGSMAVPEMIKRGYDKSLALGTAAAGGTLGILIPPSVPMIIYGVLTETSIGDLFIAGILPGIMMAFLFSATVVLKVILRPELAPPLERRHPLARQAARAGVRHPGGPAVGAGDRVDLFRRRDPDRGRRSRSRRRNRDRRRHGVSALGGVAADARRHGAYDGDVPAAVRRRAVQLVPADAARHSAGDVGVPD